MFFLLLCKNRDTLHERFMNFFNKIIRVKVYFGKSKFIKVFYVEEWASLLH